MSEFADIIKYFSGINTWIALAGAALFTFLVLFKTAAEKLVVNLKVPSGKAAGVVHMFMLLVALVTLFTLTLAFLDAKDARADASAQANAQRKQQQLADRQTAIDACILENVSDANFSLSFSSEEQGVRCPGGGCFGQSSTCNFREGWVSYTAPGDYYIEKYEIVKGSMNDGNITGLGVYERDTEDRATAVRAKIWCDPDNRPGAGGGWANASVKGVIRLRNESQARSDIVARCEQQNPTHQPPS